MAIFRLARMLTATAWETELGRVDDPLEGALELDFADVEFVDFGALARALLLLDAAVRGGVPAIVTLPVNALTTSEERLTEEYRTGGSQEAEEVQRGFLRSARARGDALAFMRHVGFIDALSGPEWPQGAVRVVTDMTAADRPDQTGRATLTPVIADSRDAPYRTRWLLPFQWLAPLHGKRLRAAETFAIGLQDLGLSRADARALSQTVLTELVQDATEQSEPGMGFTLVGAILLTAETFALRQRDVNPDFRELAECATADDSRVLRLIVADPGSDLVSRLASAEPGAGTEQLILQAVSKWPVDHHQTNRSARSLWRVNRMVRSYRGSVLIRTNDTLAGHLYARTADGVQVAEAGLSRLPGSLYEITVLTAPSGAGRPSAWDDRPTDDDQGRLRWVEFTFDPDHGLSALDRLRLEREARRAQEDSTVIGLAAAIPVQDAAGHLSNVTMRRAMRAVLDTASRIANPTAVVTVFPDADPHVLELCVAAFNEELAVTSGIGWASPHSPIMVLGAFGGARWCGGPAPLRAVLTTLINAGGTLDAGQAVHHWQQAGGDPAEFRQALRDQTQLLAVHASMLQLRLSPNAVHRTLAERVEGALFDAIDKGGPGVERVRVRGPALRITDRSIDVDALLTGTVGTPLAAFVLARKSEAELRRLAVPVQPTTIVGVSSAGPGLVRQISECLGLGGRSYPSLDELEIGELPMGERVPPGASVVLCTDLISTENSVRRAAAAIAGGRAEPLIIACVVDARERREPIRLLNHTIQVVSLVEVEIGADGGGSEPVIDLDPLLLRPHVPIPAAQPPVPESEFLRWCGEVSGALRLGHVDQPPNRHVSAFIRLDSLLRHKVVRRRITDATLATVAQAFAELQVADLPGKGDCPWEIWHSSSRSDSPYQLAEAIRGEVTRRGERALELIRVPRGIAGNVWAFPSEFREGGPPRPIVVLGWTTTTGGTMLHLIRLAARSGATAVVAVSVVDQMGTSDSEVLRMVSSVVGQDGRDVPVAIRFVTNSSITPLNMRDCAVCAAQERYEMDEEATPERLRAHAEQLQEILRPRWQEELSRGAATDLFTVPISNDDAIDYLRWRGLLLRALRELTARKEIIDRLSILAQGESPVCWSLPGLIRLLAAEQQWLKLPPLRFADARQLLCGACVTGLQKSATSPAWLRVQALIVLSGTVPDRLAELLLQILPAISDEPVLVDQIFLDLYRLLRRPPLDSPIDNEKLRQSLSQVREYLEKNESAHIAAHRYVVRELINIVRYRSRRPPQTAQEAWDSLREELVRPVKRHRLEAAILRVRGFVEDLVEVQPTPQTTRNALGDWEECENQLKQRALIYLPALREIIAGEYASDRLRRTEQPRLLRAIESDDMALVSVNDLLNRLANDPWQPGDPRWQDTRDRLIRRLEWWNMMFLAAHVPGSDAPALLVRLIGSAPTELGAAVSASLQAHGHTAATDRSDLGDVEVFCPRELLEELIAHLLANTRRHRIPRDPLNLRLAYSRPDAETVRFALSNTGTRARERTGNGLMMLNDRIRPFGGKLTYWVPDEDEWAFTVAVTLQKWRGA